MKVFGITVWERTVAGVLRVFEKAVTDLQDISVRETEKVGEYEQEADDAMRYANTSRRESARAVKLAASISNLISGA